MQFFHCKKNNVNLQGPSKRMLLKKLFFIKTNDETTITYFIGPILPVYRNVNSTNRCKRTKILWRLIN